MAMLLNIALSMKAIIILLSVFGIFIVVLLPITLLFQRMSIIAQLLPSSSTTTYTQESSVWVPLLQDRSSHSVVWFLISWKVALTIASYLKAPGGIGQSIPSLRKPTSTTWFVLLSQYTLACLGFYQIRLGRGAISQEIYNRILYLPWWKYYYMRE